MPKIVATEEQWIRLGAERFAEGGADALVVESMAAALKCSKSSFYWYFANRGEFVRRVVDYWAGKTTRDVMAASSRPKTAEEKISELLQQMFSVTGKGDFLFYLRRLAEREPEYQPLLDGMEQSRMRFAGELFMEAGSTAEDAGRKAWLLYHYYLGWYERHKRTVLTREEVLEHAAWLREHLIRR